MCVCVQAMEQVSAYNATMSTHTMHVSPHIVNNANAGITAHVQQCVHDMFIALGCCSMQSSMPKCAMLLEERRGR